MRYIKYYFITFTLTITAIALFNWFIDPFGMYWSAKVSGVNIVKPESGSRTKITKAYQVHNVSPQILLVGNSRVEMGLSPINSNFLGKTVYNQGIPGAGLTMQVSYAEDVIDSNPHLEQIFMGIDFLDFIMSTEELLNYQNKTSPRIPSYNFRLKSTIGNSLISLEQLKEKSGFILSLDALKASIYTIFQQHAHVNSISALGFNSAESYISIMEHEGIKPLFKQKLAEIDGRLKKKSWHILASNVFPYSPYFEQLGRIIKAANQKNIKLTFFINPYHSSYLHTIADNKQWNNFQLWKATLVEYIHQTDHKVILWDFSSFSKFVNEEVQISTPSKHMSWYWEPAHYRKELGDLIINTLVKNESQQNFGKRLTLTNIAALLTENTTQLNNSRKSWEILKSNLQKQ